MEHICLSEFMDELPKAFAPKAKTNYNCPCKFCDLKFKTSRDLANHVLRMHASHLQLRELPTVGETTKPKEAR